MIIHNISCRLERNNLLIAALAVALLLLAACSHSIGNKNGSDSLSSEKELSSPVALPVPSDVSTPATPAPAQTKTLLAQSKISAPVTPPANKDAIIALPDMEPPASRQPSATQSPPIQNPQSKIQNPITILLSQPPPPDLRVRRVSNNDGLLYLEIYSPTRPLTGSAQVQLPPAPAPGAPAPTRNSELGTRNFSASTPSLWLSLTPRIGTLTLNILPLPPRAEGALASPSAFQPFSPLALSTPTTLVETRARQLYLNNEPFLVKGTTGGPSSPETADYLRTLGINTIRGSQSSADCERYGFMSIVSINPINTLIKEYDASTAAYNAKIPATLARAAWRSDDALANPNALILQLGNECVPKSGNLDTARARVTQMLTATRNILKQLCPMLPVAYANNDTTLLAPPSLDLIMHNSYLDKDRSHRALLSYIKKQGGLPPDGPAAQGRPFLMSEFGASTYLSNAYHGGKYINPILEKIHAWNIPNRWAEIIEAGAIGGSIYKLTETAMNADDKSSQNEGGGGCGILTGSYKPKLAAYEVRRLWRDFTLEVRGPDLLITYPRPYYARDCTLTITPLNGEPRHYALDDFAPSTTRTIPLKTLALPPGAATSPNANGVASYSPGLPESARATLGNNNKTPNPNGVASPPELARQRQTVNREPGTVNPGGEAPPFRWRLDYTTHSGLPAASTGACPLALEEQDFLAQLSTRDTAPFLTELFDTEVLTITAAPAPRTTAEMATPDGLIPIILRKRNGTAYLVIIIRQDPNNTPLKKNITLDIAFQGTVEKVDDITGLPLPDKIDATPTPTGLHLKNLEAARIPSRSSTRSKLPFTLPVYRITPQTQ